MFSLVNKHEEFFDFLVTNAECSRFFTSLE